MAILALHIQKGGQGKTTLTGNIGFSLSKMNKKVLLIDVDASQGNLSTWLLKEEPKYEIGDALYKMVDPSEAIYKIRDNLYLMPTFGVGSKLKEYSENQLHKPENAFIFEDLCDELKNYNYDYIIFDLSPGMNRLEKSVLLAVDEVLNPLQSEFFGFDGIEIFNSELESQSKLRQRIKKPELIHNTIIANSINFSYKTHKETLKQFEKLNYNIFIVNQDRKIADAQFIQKFAQEVDANQRSIKQLDEIAKYIINR